MHNCNSHILQDWLVALKLLTRYATDPIQCTMPSPALSNPNPLRLQQLIPLLPPLQPLHAFRMHLLRHLLKPLLLQLRGSSVLDPLNMCLV